MADAKGILLLVARIILFVLVAAQLVTMCIWFINTLSDGNLSANNYRPAIRLILYLVIAIIDVYGIIGVWNNDRVYLINFAIAMGVVIVIMIILQVSIKLSNAELADGVGGDIIRILLALACYWMIGDGWQAGSPV